MAALDLTKVGNVDYEHEPQIAMPLCISSHPELALKLYAMVKQQDVSQSHLTCGFSKTALDFIDGIILQLEPLSGLGFTIFSEDVINVVRWDTDFPILVNNQIYSYENGDVRTAKQEDVGEFGSFCVWEEAILHHERNAWLKYLQSERTEADKMTYLMDQKIGLLE